MGCGLGPGQSGMVDIELLGSPAGAVWKGQPWGRALAAGSSTPLARRGRNPCPGHSPTPPLKGLHPREGRHHRVGSRVQLLSPHLEPPAVGSRSCLCPGGQQLASWGGCQMWPAGQLAGSTGQRSLCRTSPGGRRPGEERVWLVWGQRAQIMLHLLSLVQHSFPPHLSGAVFSKQEDKINKAPQQAVGRSEPASNGSIVSGAPGSGPAALAVINEKQG